jgi:hypothetical protein
MTRISTLNDFQRLIGAIMEEGKNFLSPIKDMEDNLDIFKVYEKTIELASNYFEVEVTVSNIPFFMKFDLVSFVFNYIHCQAGIDTFIKNIFTTSFNSNSQLLIEIKKDYRVCMDLANLGCLIDNYEWPYLLLNHIYQNVDSIPKHFYSIIIRELSFLLESLSGIIQKKLFNDESDFMNKELVEFTFAFMQDDSSKKDGTIVYKRLLTEHLEILKVYRQAVQTLKRLQIRNSILA